MHSTTSVSPRLRKVRTVVGVILLSCSFSLASAHRAEAQVLEPSGVTAAPADSAHAIIQGVDSDTSRYPHAGVRIGLGIVGAAAGGFGGFYAGAFLARGCHGDMCGLGPAVLGALGGSVLSSALMSAIPRLGSSCSFADRVGAGIIGAAGGTVAGLLGLVGGPLVVGTLPLGGGFGAGLGTASCANGVAR